MCGRVLGGGGKKGYKETKEKCSLFPIKRTGGGW